MKNSFAKKRIAVSVDFRAGKEKKRILIISNGTEFHTWN